MDTPFGQLVLTLEKARDTMGSQLERLSTARVPDSVRLPRLQREAGQLKAAATALIAGVQRLNRDLGLVLQLKALVTFFGEAERRAAILLPKEPSVKREPLEEQDDEPYSEAAAHDEANWVLSRRVGNKQRPMRVTPRAAGC